MSAAYSERTICTTDGRNTAGHRIRTIAAANARRRAVLMMIYLVKPVRREPETDALMDWLDARHGSTKVSSALVDVELPRALRRTEPALLPNVPAVLERPGRYEIDDLVRRTAASYPQPELLSLDAIHPATAHAVFGPELEHFASYYTRLLQGSQVNSAADGQPRSSLIRRSGWVSSTICIRNPFRSCSGVGRMLIMRTSGGTPAVSRQLPHDQEGMRFAGGPGPAP